MSSAGSIATKIVAVAVVVMIVAAILAVTLAPPPVSNPDINSYAGLKDGDVFNYTLSGTFNSTTVTGVLNTSYSQRSWSYWPIAGASRELNDTLNPWTPSTLLQLDVGKFATPFGTKNVVRVFGIRILPNGMASTTISYVGVNPNVVYGFALNGPMFHLLLTLGHTNNGDVKTGNTNAITWHSPNTDPKVPTTGGGTISRGVTTTGWFYAPNGGQLHYNLTGDRVDVWAFSESNLRSMADGGPFAYDLSLSRWGVTNQSGDVLVPVGVFVVSLGMHGDGQGHLEYSVA